MEYGELDPLELLEKEMSFIQTSENIPGMQSLVVGVCRFTSLMIVLNTLNLKHKPEGFEPKNSLNLPESAMMMLDEIVADHVFQRFQVISNMRFENTDFLKSDDIC